MIAMIASVAVFVLFAIGYRMGVLVARIESADEIRDLRRNNESLQRALNFAQTEADHVYKLLKTRVATMNHQVETTLTR